jgi:hypothetical protein
MLSSLLCVVTNCSFKISMIMEEPKFWSCPVFKLAVRILRLLLPAIMMWWDSELDLDGSTVRNVVMSCHHQTARMTAVITKCFTGKSQTSSQLSQALSMYNKNLLDIYWSLARVCRWAACLLVLVTDSASDCATESKAIMALALASCHS